MSHIHIVSYQPIKVKAEKDIAEHSKKPRSWIQEYL